MKDLIKNGTPVKTQAHLDFWIKLWPAVRNSEGGAIRTSLDSLDTDGPEGGGA